MSDDLVTRLRELSGTEPDTWKAFTPVVLLREAADEIERLTRLYGDAIVGQQEFAERAERVTAERDEAERRYQSAQADVEELLALLAEARGWVECPGIANYEPLLARIDAALRGRS
jgi:aldehyde:ferredoxin oxidoreductase